MDCLDLLAVQGTLKSLLQHHSSKASILWHSAFFTVQLSHPYMTTGKIIALFRRTFVGKVMSLLFNMLSRLVITFLRDPLIGSEASVLLSVLPDIIQECYWCGDRMWEEEKCCIVPWWSLSFSEPELGISPLPCQLGFGKKHSLLGFGRIVSVEGRHC